MLSGANTYVPSAKKRKGLLNFLLFLRFYRRGRGGTFEKSDVPLQGLTFFYRFFKRMQVVA